MREPSSSPDRRRQPGLDWRPGRVASRLERLTPLGPMPAARMDFRIGQVTPEDLRKEVDELISADWFTVRHDEIPWPVKVRLGQAPDGRLVCTGLVIGAVAEPAEISSRALHRLGLGQVLTQLANLAAKGNVVASWVVEAAASPSAPPALAKVRPGPGGYPRDHFERIAGAYRLAMMRRPEAPVLALTHQFDVSAATVRRWLRRARDMGLLGESTPGRAGEKPPKRRRKR